MSSVIHHYAIDERGKSEPFWVAALPVGCKILTVALREGTPVVYVQKPTRTNGPDATQLLMIIAVYTGQEFLLPNRYTYLGTLILGTGEVVHYYGRMKDQT